MNRHRHSPYFDLLASLGARLFDGFWLLISAYIAYFLRFEHMQMPLSYQTIIVIAILLVSLVSSQLRLYVSWRGKSRIALVWRVMLTQMTSFSLLVLWILFSHQGEHFSRIWLASWFAGHLAGVIVFRVLVYYVLGNLRSKGLNQKKVIIVGTGRSARTTIEHLLKEPWTGYRIEKVIPVGTSRMGNYYKDISVAGSVHQLPELIQSLNIDEVWICLPLKMGETVYETLYTLRHNTVDIRYVPDFSDVRLLNHKSTEIAGIYALDLSCSPMMGVNLFLKTLEDRLLGLIIFMLIAPVLLIIAIGVKLSSPGPVIFKQYRHGVDGKKFRIYKFRSMHVHEDSKDMLEQATLEDQRITAFGRFIRRTSLDELPQFFNVIQGKMSIVGPRPHALSHNEYYKDLIESYMKRHKVKPGITGWAQVHGFRGETDSVDKMAKRVEYDLYYIENWSLMLDIKIILITLFKGFLGKNAY